VFFYIADHRRTGGGNQRGVCLLVKELPISVCQQISAYRYGKYFIKTQRPQSGHGLFRLYISKSRRKGRCEQRINLYLILQHGKRLLDAAFNFFRVLRTDANATTAADAPFLNDHGLTFFDADGLGRTIANARITALAAILDGLNDRNGSILPLVDR